MKKIILFLILYFFTIPSVITLSLKIETDPEELRIKLFLTTQAIKKLKSEINFLKLKNTNTTSSDDEINKINKNLDKAFNFLETNSNSKTKNKELVQKNNAEENMHMSSNVIKNKPQHDSNTIQSHSTPSTNVKHEAKKNYYDIIQKEVDTDRKLDHELFEYFNKKVEIAHLPNEDVRNKMNHDVNPRKNLRELVTKIRNNGYEEMENLINFIDNEPDKIKNFGGAPLLNEQAHKQLTNSAIKFKEIAQSLEQKTNNKNINRFDIKDGPLNL
jgi:hypothetical protein